MELHGVGYIFVLFNVVYICMYTTNGNIMPMSPVTDTVGSSMLLSTMDCERKATGAGHWTLHNILQEP